MKNQIVLDTLAIKRIEKHIKRRFTSEELDFARSNYGSLLTGDNDFYQLPYIFLSQLINEDYYVSEEWRHLIY